MTKRALILIDIQNDYFAHGKWPLHQMEASAHNAQQLLKLARANNELVVHVRHENHDDDAPFFTPNSVGAQFHPCVQPFEDEKVIVKNQVNAFLNTDLEATLQWHNIDAVTIAGSMSHMCIDAATRAASDKGFEVTVIEDACASHDMEFAGNTIAATAVHGSFMFALQFAYVNVMTTDDYLKRN